MLQHKVQNEFFELFDLIANTMAKMLAYKIDSNACDNKEKDYTKCLQWFDEFSKTKIGRQGRSLLLYQEIESNILSMGKVDYQYGYIESLIAGMVKGFNLLSPNEYNSRGKAMYEEYSIFKTQLEHETNRSNPNRCMELVYLCSMLNTLIGDMLTILSKICAIYKVKVDVRKVLNILHVDHNFIPSEAFTENIYAWGQVERCIKDMTKNKQNTGFSVQQWSIIYYYLNAYTKNTVDQSGFIEEHKISTTSKSFRTTLSIMKKKDGK